jgi:uncharacterized damage-inducible protein DinB
MKTFDLVSDTKMSPITGMLHAMVNYNFQRLKRLVDGMTQEEIDYKGADNILNSVAQLLKHLAIVDLHWVYRLQSTEIPKEIKEVFGPMYDEEGKLPMVRNISLHHLLEQYDQVQDLLKEVCSGLTDNDLEKMVPFENGNTATIRWGIWHIADHNRHHYANIAQLKNANHSKRNSKD